MAQYIGIAEVSRLTGLSVTALRKGARTGRFSHIRLDKNNPRSKLLYNLEQVKQVLADEAQAAMNTHKEVKNQ